MKELLLDGSIFKDTAVLERVQSRLRKRSVVYPVLHSQRITLTLASIPSQLQD